MYYIYIYRLRWEWDCTPFSQDSFVSREDTQTHAHIHAHTHACTCTHTSTLFFSNKKISKYNCNHTPPVSVSFSLSRSVRVCLPKPWKRRFQSIYLFSTNIHLTRTHTPTHTPRRTNTQTHIVSQTQDTSPPTLVNKSFLMQPNNLIPSTSTYQLVNSFLGLFQNGIKVGLGIS